MHRANPRSGLWRLAERDADFGTPYWAYDWGGGLALARHVLDNPQCVAGRRALDLGAGSGIVGIAAMLAGAEEAIGADTDPYAIAAMGLNAAANSVAVASFAGDLTAGPAPSVDIVLVGDLFYDSHLAERVTMFLERCLAAHIKVLIGDPWRASCLMRGFDCWPSIQDRISQATTGLASRRMRSFRSSVSFAVSIYAAFLHHPPLAGSRGGCEGTLP